MNRDALLATLIGFGVGLLIMGGILVGPNIVKNFPQVSIPKFSIALPKRSAQPTPLPSTPAGAPFTIDSPLPDSLQSTPEMPVSGSAIGATFVVIQGPGNEAVSVPSGEGKYAGTLELVEGRNDITVTAYDGNAAQKLTVTVYFTSEGIE